MIPCANTVGLCCLSILYTVAYICKSQTPNLSLSTSPLLKEHATGEKMEGCIDQTRVRPIERVAATYIHYRV